MGELCRAAAGRVARRFDWRATTILALALTCTTSLLLISTLERSLGSTSDARVALTGALAWAGIAGYVGARGRLGRMDGAAVITSTIVVLGYEGIALTDVNLSWMSAASLVAVPVASVMLLGTRGVVVMTVIAMAAAASIGLQLDAAPEVRFYCALTLASIVAAPVTVVGVLVRRLETARDLANRLSVTDPLTGLSNRRGIDEGAPAVVAAAASTGELLTVMVLDLDHFKAVNDAFGHAVGDQVLSEVAGALIGVARSGDLVVRLGGEELGWVARFPRADDAVQAADRLRVAVRTLPLLSLPAVTVSIGVATVRPAADDDPVGLVLSMMTTADHALYQAKRAGRDRVVLAGAPLAAPATSS